MTVQILADAAPTGAGLAIVAVILLGLFAVFVGGIALVVILLVRRRNRRLRAQVPGPGAQQPGAGLP